MSGFANKSVDPAMVARARRGDMKAHEVIFRILGNPVYTLAFRITRSRATAEDVLQETFLEVIRSIRHYRREASLATWIRRIAVSKCLMHMRSAWNRRGRLYGDLTDLDMDPQPDSFTETRGVELRMDLESALECLAPTSRIVVLLHDVEGYTHREIGAMMQKTASFSKSQLARAHQRLQEVLAVDVPVMSPAADAPVSQRTAHTDGGSCTRTGQPRESKA